jgi:hypothetical protein
MNAGTQFRPKQPAAGFAPSAWRRKAESGFTISIQSIFYILMLFIFFALIYDFGNVGYAFSMASNVARLAAQDAAKNIDEDTFLNLQEIRLAADALERAQEMVDGMTNSRMVIDTLTISRLQTRDVIMLQAHVVVQLPVLNAALGIDSVTIPIEGYAEPAYGISEEGQ